MSKSRRQGGEHEEPQGGVHHSEKPVPICHVHSSEQIPGQKEPLLEQNLNIFLLSHCP